MKLSSKITFVPLAVMIPFLLLNTGCGFTSLLGSTETPTPTQTSSPTSTSTSTPTATITPNLRATQAAEQELAIRDFLTTLDLPANTGSVGWIQDEPISIEIEGYASYTNPFAEDFAAGDFVISTEMTWNTDTWTTCGVLFRTNSDVTDFYMAVFHREYGVNLWYIDYYKDDSWVSTITGHDKKSSFLSSDDGATNQITVAAVGNEFKVYINGNFVGRYYDWSSKLSEGEFAFVAFQMSGNTTCTFDNTWIWIYK